MILLAVYALILVVSILLTAQAVFTLGLMLYTWARPERLEESDSPDEYLPPQLSFTAILPAKNEEGVIGHTLRQVWESNYPKKLFEVVVVCEESDRGPSRRPRRRRPRSATPACGWQLFRAKKARSTSLAA